jgi:catechol 2,3-dioxygenase-like lactoylglutathione lyase family enzyme
VQRVAGASSRAVKVVAGDAVVKRLSLLNVYVKNQDSAIEFYTNKLGFVVAEDVPYGPQRWVTLRLPDDEVVSLSLSLAETDEDRALIGKQGGSHPFFGIVTDDCVAEYRRMKNAGVRFHGEPEVQPYGTGVTLEDLYGNKIYLNQEPAGPLTD